MTGKLIFALTHAQSRQNAAQAVMQAPDGYFVTLKPATRSLEANARMWAMLTEISRQVNWHGRKLTPEEWKHVFTAALTKQDVVPGIEGGFVVLGKATSTMTRGEMSELQTLIEAFGAQQNVKFTDPDLRDSHE